MALTTYGVGITTGAINTKGTYHVLAASTPYASSRLHLAVLTAGTGRRSYLIDLAVGGAGAETVVVSNVPVISDGDFLFGSQVAIDVDIPAGSRLTVRAQSPVAAQTISVNVRLEDRPLASIANPVTYGSFTNSIGVIVDASATADVKGSYVQLTNSTTALIDALVLCVTLSIDSPTLASFTGWYIDVATGPAGEEQVVLDNIYVLGSLNTDSVRPALTRLPMSVPAGTRIAVRISCNRTTAIERRLAITAIGLQEPTLISGTTIDGATIASTTTIFLPTIEGAAPSVGVETIASTTVVFLPTVVGGAGESFSVVTATLASMALVFVPTIVGSGVSSVSVATIALTTSIFLPTVVRAVIVTNALQLNDATAIIHRTSGFVAGAADFTCCFWYQPIFAAADPDYITAFVLVNVDYTEYVGAYSANSYYDMTLIPGGNTADVFIPVAAIRHLAFVRDGTEHRFYVDGVLIDTLTEDFSAVEFTELMLGYDGYSLADGLRFANWREWDVALTPVQLIAEMYSRSAVKTTGLFTDTPLATDLLDDSGNSHHWLGAGNYEFAYLDLPVPAPSATIVRVQTTPKAEGPAMVPLVMTFGTPPDVGNAIVVPVIGWSSLFATCTDNWGNTYVLAAESVGQRVAQFVCAKVVTTGAPFRVTVTHGSDSVAAAIEVTGFPTTLGVDKYATNAATSNAPNSGATPLLTSNDVFVVGNFGGSSTLGGITVENVTPAWVQEFESLSSDTVPGEGDSRSLTGMLGATTSISWTPSLSSIWQALVVAYRATTPPAIPPKTVVSKFQRSSLSMFKPTVVREVIIVSPPDPPLPELLHLYNLTGKVLVGGSAIICFVGPPHKSVKWSLEGHGKLTPFTTFTDQFGRCSCRYDAGNVVETAIINAEFVP